MISRGKSIDNLDIGLQRQKGDTTLWEDSILFFPPYPRLTGYSTESSSTLKSTETEAYCGTGGTGYLGRSWQTMPFLQ